MKKYSFIIPIFLLLVFFVYARKRKSKTKNVFKNMNLDFSKITATPKIRECDPMGCGYYGAKRKGHVHHGVDVIAQVGEKIYAPITGSVRRLYVYGNSNAMRGIEIKNSKYRVKIFYLNSNYKTNEFVNQGDVIGVAQNIAAYHHSEGVMTNHVHVEVWKYGVRINPTNLIL